MPTHYCLSAKLAALKTAGAVTSFANKTGILVWGGAAAAGYSTYRATEETDENSRFLEVALASGFAAAGGLFLTCGSVMLNNSVQDGIASTERQIRDAESRTSLTDTTSEQVNNTTHYQSV